MFPRIITNNDATIWPISFFLGTKRKTSSFRPKKKRIITPPSMNLSSDDSEGNVKKMVEIVKPPNIARPPSIGTSLLCEDLPFGTLKIFLYFAIFTIVGIGKKVIENDRINAPVRTSHSGINEAKELRLGLNFFYLRRSIKCTKIKKFL